MKMSFSALDAPNFPDGEYGQRLLSEAARHISQIMQLSGIRSVMVDVVRTNGLQCPSLSEVFYFDGVPPFVSEVAPGLACAIARFMSSYGISEILLTEERGDMDRLSSMWSEMGSPSPAEPSYGRTGADADAGDVAGEPGGQSVSVVLDGSGSAMLAGGALVSGEPEGGDDAR